MNRFYWVALAATALVGIACGSSDRHSETPVDTQGAMSTGGLSSSNMGSSDEVSSPTAPSGDPNGTAPSGTPSPSPGTSRNESPDQLNPSSIDARSTIGAQPLGAGGMAMSGGRSSSSTGGRNGSGGTGTR